MNYFRYNIKEHNHILFSSFKASENRTSFWKSLWGSFKWTLKNLVKECKSLRKIFRQHNVAPIIFLTMSSNNTRTLRPIWERLDANTYTVIEVKDLGLYFPWLWLHYYSLLYSWPLIWTYIRASKSEKAIIETYYESFFSTIAYIKLSVRLMKRNNVKLVVMANDHIVLPRSFLIAARALNITTIYTQHSSVTERFPSLLFTYSFLDGEESLAKYVNVGNMDSNVYLSGSPRFDEIVKYRKVAKANVEVVGVAFNLLDDEARVKDLCICLKQKGFSKIIVRPHPRQNVDKKWYIDNDFVFSDSKCESPYEYINGIDLLISGESGIHLDAILMGVPSVCYDMNGKGLIDWYSYVKNGLMPYVKDDEELDRVLLSYRNGSLKSMSSKAEFYNASYGKSIDGHIGDTIADFIKLYMSNSFDAFDKKYNFVKKIICGKEVKCIE